MTRGTKKRTWVKLDCQGVLHGSINWLFTLEEQAIFLKLIPMAAIYCKKPGIISDNEGKPLPREFIAYELHCSLDALESVIQKGTEDNCLRDTEQGIELVNFKYYQFTEYDRQRPYRQAKQAKEKCKYGEFKNVLLTLSEYDKLKTQFDNGADALIERLSSYIKSKGKKYKDHYATILNWQRRDTDGKAKNSRAVPKTYTPGPSYDDL